jgi:hypothetical protein
MENIGKLFEWSGLWNPGNIIHRLSPVKYIENNTRINVYACQGEHNS